MTDLLTPDVETTPHPMLSGFASMHAAMRRDVARLPGAIAGADRQRARALGEWYDRFRHTLESHHAREDDIVWPQLASRSEPFSAALPGLLRDHDDLDVALAAASEALGALAADPTESTRSVACLAADHLATVLVEHLAREEAAAFAELPRCFTAQEWGAIEEAMVKATPIRALAFEAPWSLLAMPDADRAARIAEIPASLRLLYRFAFRPRYERLVRRAGL